ncbi:SPOR domain-containing protein [Phaeovulum veldkampii]|nr:SPOR domain-containing protein [Phaeovulum veldkampii]TDQ59234.1 sporulation related protein [Phaeovulum veldkampii DSM 11550]
MAGTPFRDSAAEDMGRAGAARRPVAVHVSKAVGYAGAATSLALIAGLAFWGYRLAVRDVTGVPVVRALEGPARVAPDDPGGDLARHVGLSVNAVAAAGLAASAPDRVVLAPQPDELAPEDAPMTALAPLPAPAPEAVAPAPLDLQPRPAALPVPDAATRAAATAARQAEATALALAEAMAEDPEPAPEADEEPLVATLAPAAAAPETPAAPAAGVIPASVPGVARSPRPAVKPAAPRIVAQASASASTASVAPGALDLDPDSLAPGTRLVQLGAFDDPATAKAEWDRVAGRFGGLMAGKRRVIQQAVAGGRTFYRLRVEGFADVSDARGFCAALLAEQQSCIPAQAR